MKRDWVHGSARRWGAALLMLIFMAGCRTYGGHGSEEATMAQIVAANQVFAEELARAQRDLGVLEGAAGRSPGYATFAERYRNIALAHQAMLAQHREWEEEAESDWDDYRLVSRILRGILSEHQIIRDRYVQLFFDLERGYSIGLAEDTTATVPGGVRPEGRYYVVPPFYERILHANTLRIVSSTLPDQVGGAGALGTVPRDTLSGETPAAPAPELSSPPAGSAVGNVPAPEATPRQ